MTFVNSVLGVVFDGLLYPFRGFHPLVGLALVSLLTALVMLPVIKYTSDQKKLEAVKRKIHASLFEIRLFNDNVRAILRALFDIVRHNGTYLWLWLVPLLWLIAPLVLTVAQLQFNYGYRGLEPGETTLLEVRLDEERYGGADKPNVQLTAPSGVVVDTPAVWSPVEAELTWRLRAEDWGEGDLELTIDGEPATKNIQVSEVTKRRSPIRTKPGFMDQLLYPAEAPLAAASAVESIEIVYPPGDAGVGIESELTWMLVFFALSLVFALMLRGPMGVTF